MPGIFVSVAIKGFLDLGVDLETIQYTKNVSDMSNLK
jgi:hypothetical protein